jgi:peptidoglycan hydrolase-like protein with peptidoglycan-binding domain
MAVLSREESLKQLYSSSGLSNYERSIIAGQYLGTVAARLKEEANKAYNPQVRDLPPPPPSKSNDRPTLSYGSGNTQAVVELQKRLTSLGYNTGGVDGDFGPKTKAAVIAFQQRNDLEPDGVVGSKTWDALSP